ncbi:hypothetical protein ACIRBX_27405 [Kitasatospora sp. NPDC096147]|uniref:hypothetical protein n=1 Tax=Kitasatospora sp. NPDC096147 TaxID=3364093 RepID=UPI0038166422
MPPTPIGDSGPADPPPQPADTDAGTVLVPPPPAPPRFRPRELANALLAALVLACVALGVWRAVALGADGLAAGTFILAAAALLSSGVISFNRWQLRPAYAVVALLVAAALTASVGRWGQHYFANQPVDVTSQIDWPADPATATITATARLAVPKNLDSLDISVVLVDLRPTVGDCGDSTFKVLRLGDVRPAEYRAGPGERARARSGDTVTVRIPPRVKQVDLVLTVDPAPSCEMTAYIQLARFHNSEK